MSGKIESKQDSPRSHLSSFTTKLKDKFQSPKVKRSNSKNVSRPVEALVPMAVQKPDNKSLSPLEEQEKDVVSALRYFKTIVDKMALDRRVLEMLPGSTSQVLEAVLPLVKLEPIQHCSAVASCLACIYQSLANLIRWSDQVLLSGANLDHNQTMGTVTTVIKAVLDGVKELVRLTREPQEAPPPITPATPPASSTPTTPDAEAPVSKNEDSTTPPPPAQCLGREPPPPKPPLLSGNALENGPPALPPKRRSSAPGPPKVAVVAPMRRTSCTPQTISPQIQEASRVSKCVSEGNVECVSEQRLSGGGQWSYGGETVSQASRSSSHDKLDRPSGHGPQRISTEALDTTSDPYDSDYDFLQQDLSSIDALPPLVGALSPVAEASDHEPSPSSCASSFSFPNPPSSPLPPPALPEKKRRGHAPQSHAPPERRLSLYDNVSPDEIPTPPFPLSPLFPSMHQEDGPPHSPPPLPEKSRHIMKYMHFMESYSEPQPCVFYQSSQSSAVYHQRNRRFQEDYRLRHTPPPALPPKQRQLDTCATEDCPEMQSSEKPLCSDLDLAECLSRQEQEDLSLDDHSKIMSQITLKQESDDGPDVRAGSGDILLVLATETDHEDVLMYSEAFLTTYRTFITPEDLIKKLHYRYSRFCDSQDAGRKAVSQNSFCVLVRVVEELCGVELEEELLRLLMELVFRLLIGGELSLARRLRSNILDKLEQRRRLLSTTLSLRPLAARGVAARPGTLNDFRSLEIAEQLTLLDAELFYKIEIPEVLLWAKEQNEERSPNLTQFTEHFNNMSYWVRSVIMLQEKAQDREKLLLKFIRVMKHLRKLNNFNSYLAILSALDSAPLRRLEWQKQTSESLQEYSSLIDSSSSFRTYRTALAEVEPTYPCIPYLGLILQDLTFVHLGNPDLLEGKVNFSKCWQQFNILDSMRCFQQGLYDLKRNDDVVSFFNDFGDHLAEEALWELSLKIKPRNTARRAEQQERT